VKNFTISLYAFHLRNIFSDAPNKVAAGAEKLWENLAELGEASLPFPELKNLRSHLICYPENDKYNPTKEWNRPSEWLTETGSIDLGSFETDSGEKIKGNIQPFLLHDTYFADLTISPKSADFEVHPSQLKKSVYQSLLPAKINSSLGQTIWIYGESDKLDDACKTLAEKYAKSLLSESKFAANLTLVSSSKLFGSLLFEYEAADPEDVRNLAKKCHILVWINNNSSPTVQLAETGYDILRDWLCCRHKIIFVYQQAQELYATSRETYSDLEGEIKLFSTLEWQQQSRLEKLKKLLQDLPEKYLKYSGSLRDLEIQLTGLKTNAENYHICLRKIKEIGGNNKELEIFHKFSKSIALWQKQVKTYLEYLEPGKELFNRAIETTRGIVEIEQAEIDMKQAEIDRSLEKTIQIFGVALGTGGIFATCYVVYGNIPWSWKPTKTFHPLVSSLFLTILIAVLAGLTARWFVNRKD
jgi:hypothetical protein